MQRRETLVIRGVYVCAPSQKQIDARWIAFVCCPHERGMALRVWNVDGNILVEEQDKLEYIAVEGCAVQEVEALVIGKEGVGAMVEKEVDDVVVAALCGPQHGCCDSIAAFRVDGCAGLNKEVAERVVVIDGRPLFTNQSPLVRMSLA